MEIFVVPIVQTCCEVHLAECSVSTGASCRDLESESEINNAPQFLVKVKNVCIHVWSKIKFWAVVRTFIHEIRITLLYILSISISCNTRLCLSAHCMKQPLKALKGTEFNVAFTYFMVFSMS